MEKLTLSSASENTRIR